MVVGAGRKGTEEQGDTDQMRSGVTYSTCGDGEMLARFDSR